MADACTLSKGLYPVKSFPATIGTEGAGTVVELPTDDGVLNNEHFKKRGYKVGVNVATVRLDFCFLR